MYWLIYLVFKVHINFLYREVRNTTCLELAKPSNLQFRLSCNDTGTYHCLLDQNYTQEYEICMMWKWIPQGNCCHNFISTDVGLSILWNLMYDDFIILFVQCTYKCLIWCQVWICFISVPFLFKISWISVHGFLSIMKITV